MSNYWGYNTLGFFAPDARYGLDGPLDAFRSTVSRLHDAGIEIILDVVYNHTAEGNHLGPTLNFRGIDNTSYYWLLPDQPRYYDDFTGCGNALNLTHPRVLQMVMDSLRYWVEGLSRRWVQVRSRNHARPRAERVRSWRGVLCRASGRIRFWPEPSSLRSRGMSVPAATKSAPSPPAGRSGTTSFAAPCGVIGLVKAIVSASLAAA